MFHAQPSRPFGAEDFDALESAVMETTRGRWFLAEFARRIRSAETRQIVETLGRLEALMHTPRSAPPPPLPKAMDDAPVDALMQRLQAAIVEMSAGQPTVATREPARDSARDSTKHEDQRGRPETPAIDPKTFAEIEALSPADRLKLFY